jgi:hypothetical protein
MSAGTHGWTTAAGTGRLIFPAHFPTPTGGTLERDGKEFRFTFCGQDHACFGGD